MTDLNMDMFAFLSWLERNKEAHSLDGLTIRDGYKWYDYMWKTWLKNSDAGKRILNHSGEVTWWGGNPDMNKTTDEKTTVTGETTIEFPKQHTPESYNPNRAQLDTMTFRFYQEANCVDGTSDDSEELTVEAKSSLGIDGDGGAFYVLKTEQWAINGKDEMDEILKRVEAAVAATNPTSVHV
jgi:hypothetical protein